MGMISELLRWNWNLFSSVGVFCVTNSSQPLTIEPLFDTRSVVVDYVRRLKKGVITRVNILLGFSLSLLDLISLVEQGKGGYEASQ